MEKIIVVGVGRYGKHCIDILEMNNCEIVEIWDFETDIDEWNGYPVKKPYDYLKFIEKPDRFVLAVEYKKRKNIRYQLEELNVPAEIITDISFLAKEDEMYKNILEMFNIEDGYIKSQVFEFRNDTLYVCCPCSIGDTLYIAALMESYVLQKHENKRICMIVKSSHQDIPDWFSAIDEMVVSNELIRLLEIWTLLTQNFWLENYIYGYFKRDIFLYIDEEENKIGCTDMVSKYASLVLQIEKNSQLESLILKKNVVLEEEFGKKDIILMPYAQTAKTLPMVFWESLVQVLNSVGFRCYTNVKDESEDVIKGTSPLSRNLNDTAVICEKCLAVIALRSGICDVLALTNTILIIINTEESLIKEWNVEYAIQRNGIMNLECYGLDDCRLVMENILYVLGIL